MLGDLVAGVLAELLTPDFAPSDERRARRQVRRLRAGKEVRFPGTILAVSRRPATGIVRVRPGAAWWRPFPTTDYGEILLCRDGQITAVRPPSPRESTATGHLVVHLGGDPPRSIVVPSPFVSVLLHALPRRELS